MKNEGSAASKMVQLMRQFGYNKDTDVELATVLTPLPNLSVKLSSDGMVLERGELIVAEHLTEYTRKITINGGAEQTLLVKAALKAGDKVIVISGEDSRNFYVIDKAVE